MRTIFVTLLVLLFSLTTNRVLAEFGADISYPEPLNTNAATDSGDDWWPQITTDRMGTWLVVWSSSEPTIGVGIGSDFDILVARSTDNGLNWSPPEPLNINADSDTGDDWYPQLTTDESGNWLAV